MVSWQQLRRSLGGYMCSLAVRHALARLRVWPSWLSGACAPFGKRPRHGSLSRCDSMQLLWRLQTHSTRATKHYKHFLFPTPSVAWPRLLVYVRPDACESEPASFQRSDSSPTLLLKQAKRFVDTAHGKPCCASGVCPNAFFATILHAWMHAC